MRRAHAARKAAATAYSLRNAHFLPDAALFFPVIKSRRVGIDLVNRTSRHAHFFPNAALFFPIVKPCAVGLVDGGLRYRHATRRSGPEEIDAVTWADRGSP